MCSFGGLSLEENPFDIGEKDMDVDGKEDGQDTAAEEDKTEAEEEGGETMQDDQTEQPGEEEEEEGQEPKPEDDEEGGGEGEKAEGDENAVEDEEKEENEKNKREDGRGDQTVPNEKEEKQQVCVSQKACCMKCYTFLRCAVVYRKRKTTTKCSRSRPTDRNMMPTVRPEKRTSRANQPWSSGERRRRKIRLKR